MKTVILLQPKPSAKFSNTKLMVLEIFKKTRQKIGFDSLLLLLLYNSVSSCTIYHDLNYSRVRNKHSGTLINFLWFFFPGATSLLKGATFIDCWFFKNFWRLFKFLFLWLCIKDSNYLLFERGLRFFKGICLLFFLSIPGATFIQDPLESRGNIYSGLKS